jgi:manganese transport protein
VAVLSTSGEAGVLQLLVLSQVVLSLQLPFAVVPLLRCTSDRRLMGEFASRPWVRTLGWSASVLIIGLNLWLVSQTLGEAASGGLLAPLLVLLSLGYVALLAWIAWMPLREPPGTPRATTPTA